jgi:hypothetical protein
MPLRPELYRRLKEKFRHVAIANEGEEMIFRYVSRGDGKTMIISHFGEAYRINCPGRCGDTRKRLWINHRWGLFDPVTKSRNLHLVHCFNEECYKNDPEARRFLYSYVFDNFSTSGNDVIERNDDTTELSKEFFLPGKILELDRLDKSCHDHPALNYLRIRNYDPIQLAKDFGIGYCLEADPEYRICAGRIMIPVYRDGKAIGWQARYVGEPPYRVPKYYSMPGWKKSQCLYNFDVAKQYPYVVVCEGPTDVWRFGPESVCMFGKSPSTAQLALLGNWSNIIIVLDGDVTKDDELQAFSDALSARYGSSKRYVFVKLPQDHDPGDMSTEYLRQLVFATAGQSGMFLPAR